MEDLEIIGLQMSDITEFYTSYLPPITPAGPPLCIYCRRQAFLYLHILPHLPLSPQSR